MTPEQLELLARKCTKRDLYRADLFKIAIGSAFGGKFSPLDLIDGPPPSDEADGAMPKSNLSPSQRREKLWGKWGWPLEKLYEFAKERKYDLELYFTENELKDFEDGK